MSAGRKPKFKTGQVVVVWNTARNPYRCISHISKHELGYFQYLCSNGELFAESSLRRLTKSEACR